MWCYMYVYIDTGLNYADRQSNFRQKHHGLIQFKITGRHSRRTREVFGAQIQPTKRIRIVLDGFGLIFHVKLLLVKASGKACRVCIFGTMNPEAKTSGPFKVIDITGTAAAAEVSLGRLDGDRRHTSRIGQGLGTGVVEIGGEKVILKAGHVKIFTMGFVFESFGASRVYL
ncbi:hypothetical protein V6N13_025509 [Hibiscus sabdariffa]|uniref:Dirigent protein n=1 Tax=Hibiscus sabdariffa TaxID=183260 RepID=A0ABR2P9B4_9ROSI